MQHLLLCSREWLEAAELTDVFQPPPSPAHTRMARTAKLVQELEQQLWPYVSSNQLTVRELADIARIGAQVIGTKPEYTRPVVQPLLYKTMPQQTVQTLARQLAGNVGRYGKQPAPALYSGQPAEAGWAYAVVTDVCEADSPKHDLLKLKVTSGPAAGGYCMVRVSKNATGFLSHVLGCTLKSEKMRIPLQSTSEAVLCAAYVYLKPGVRLFDLHGDTLAHILPTDAVHGLRTSADQRSLNKALTASRSELCPQGRANPCHTCPVGYDKCPRGCHPGTLELSSELQTVALRIEGKNLCPIPKHEI